VPVLEVQSQDAVSLHGKGEFAVECRLPRASHRHQARMACVVKVSVSDVQTTSVAAEFAAVAAADLTDYDLASEALLLHVV